MIFREKFEFLQPPNFSENHKNLIKVENFICFENLLFKNCSLEFKVIISEDLTLFVSKAS